MMEKIFGKGAGGGIAAGALCFVKKNRGQIKPYHVGDTAAELERFGAAKEKALLQLGELYRKALSRVGEQGAALFEVHRMMVEDEAYCASIRNLIQRERRNAEYAVAVTSDHFSRMFSETDDLYMRERAADVRDVSDRLTRCLTGESAEGLAGAEPVVVAADDLSPSETIQLDQSKILAFVTARGSANSHTAILARTMGIPAVVGTGSLDESLDGSFCVVDGSAGEVYVRPDDATLERLMAKKCEEEYRKELLEQYQGKPNITLDGTEILVCANIGSPSELGLVRQNDAGGIGLFRSEFLYLESDGYPTEETLFHAYRTVAQAMAGKRVVFRTLDIGADKQIGYFRLAKEENPALGMRGIRLCLTRRELFRTQLRALYRASAYGKAALMFPMISSLWEVRKAKEAAREVRAELEAEGLPFDPEAEIGIMIETPAAAVISDLLAPEVDFFSIGTNDLTQYTLAVDRQNPEVEQFCDQRHEAVLRLIQFVTDNAHRRHIWVGICGELAADVSFTERFLRMGVDELSVPPSSVLRLRKAVTEVDLRKKKEKGAETWHIGSIPKSFP
jgi:phosphotransferase system enzyme I (PtsI)